MKIGKNRIEDKPMRSDATCLGLYTTNAFFIRIKEDPQISESKRRIDQLYNLFLSMI
jgi:hypothetical protein